MPSPIAYLDLDLDPALYERRTLAAGMALEKHFTPRDTKVRDKERSYEAWHQDLTHELRRPRLSPPVRSVVLHDPEGHCVRSLITSATGWLRAESDLSRFRVAPSWPDAERLSAEGPGMAVYRLPRELDVEAVLRRLGDRRREWVYLLGDPNPEPRLTFKSGRVDGLGWLLPFVSSARWVLTSHAAWPEWVPYCIYSLEDPRTLPGLDRPHIRWTSAPTPDVAPVLPEQDSPSYEFVTDTQALAQAELIDLDGTHVVSISGLAAHPSMRGLSLKDAPFVHRWELSRLPQLELLDLRGVPMRDFEPLRELRRLHTLRLDLRPRVGWEALRALPWLRHLELRDIRELDVEELAEHLTVPALTMGRSGLPAPWRVAVLSRATGLQALALRASRTDLSGLVTLPHLEALSLWGRPDTMPEGMERLSAFSLDAPGCSPGALPAMPALRRLALAVENLEGFERLPPLEYLELRSSVVDSFDLGPITTQAGVRTLVLIDFDEVPPDLLLQFSQLEGLGLSGTPVDLGPISRLSRLRRLEFTATEVDLSPLTDHPALEELVLRVDSGVRSPEALLRLPSLRRVVTSSTPLPPDVSNAMRSRGVTVHTHPLGWGFPLHPDFW